MHYLLERSPLIERYGARILFACFIALAADPLFGIDMHPAEKALAAGDCKESINLLKGLLPNAPIEQKGTSETKNGDCIHQGPAARKGVPRLLEALEDAQNKPCLPMSEGKNEG